MPFLINEDRDIGKIGGFFIVFMWCSLYTNASLYTSRVCLCGVVKKETSVAFVYNVGRWELRIHCGEEK